RHHRFGQTNRRHGSGPAPRNKKDVGHGKNRLHTSFQDHRYGQQQYRSPERSLSEVLMRAGKRFAQIAPQIAFRFLLCGRVLYVCFRQFNSITHRTSRRINANVKYTFMATSAKSLRSELITLSQLFYERRWSLATSSNFSVRLDPGRILITASGKDKGNLKETDFVEIDLSGGPRPRDSKVKPSAETYLHAELYRHDPEIGAVLHTHSVYATILSEKFARHGRFELSGYEMLKALRGVSTHEHTEIIPIFPNNQDMTALSRIVLALLRQSREVHSFLIERHGLYTWGRDLAEAKRHIEAIEFLFECECRKAYNMDSGK